MSNNTFSTLFILATLGAAAGSYACYSLMRQHEGWRAWAWGAGLVLSTFATVLNLLMSSANDIANERAERLAEKRKRRGFTPDE